MANREPLDPGILRHIMQLSLRKAQGLDPVTMYADFNNREVRRRVMKAYEESERDWKAGKPIQKKQQLQYMNTIWEASGLRILGSDHLFDFPPDIVARPWHGQNAAIDIAAAGMTTMIPLALNRDPSSDEAMALLVSGIQPLLYASFVFSRANRLSKPNVFNVSDALVENLLMTDVSGLKPDDVRPPFPGFYIHFSPGILSMKNEMTGHHDVTLVGISEGVLPDDVVWEGHLGGRSLFGVFWGEPNKGSTSTGDDNVVHMTLSLSEKMDSLSEAIEERRVPLTRSMLDGDTVRFLGQSYGYEEGCQMLRRFMANFCLFLSSPSPDIEPMNGGQGTWGNAVEMAEAKRTQTKLRIEHKPGQYASWDVGRRARRLSTVVLPQDIIVRGHWRRQAHGKARTLRKVIWIEPHIRNASDKGQAPGHDYDHTP